MFETTGTIDKKFYDKYTFVLYSGILRSFLFGALGGTIGAAVVTIPMDSIFELVLLTEFLIVFVIIAIIAILYIKRCKKLIFAQLAETTGKASYICTSYFEEDSAIFKNHALNSTAKILYNNFIKFKKSDSVWFLFTKAGLFVPVFVENLSVEEQEDLLNFLKNHLTNVKKI